MVEANDSASALFGRSRQSLVAMDLGDLSAPVQADGRPAAQAASERIARAAAGDASPFEWIYRDAAGHDLPCEVRLTLLPIAGRRLLRVSVVDIGERKLAEALRIGQSRLLEM